MLDDEPKYTFKPFEGDLGDVLCHYELENWVKVFGELNT